MNVDVISPAYGEKGNLKKLTDDFLGMAKKDSDRDYQFLLVVNENDSGPTPVLAEELASNLPMISVVRDSTEPGFGNAFKAGFRQSQAPILVSICSDLADDPSQIPRLVEKIEAGYDMVYGSRFLPESTLNEYSPVKLFFNRGFHQIASLLFRLQIKDISNGFKAYTRNLLEVVDVNNLSSSGYEFNIELPIKAEVEGFTTTEVPVDWQKRRAGESNFSLMADGLLYGYRLMEIYFNERKN